MVDSLISIGIYLVHQSFTDELWHVEVLLQLLDAKVVLGLALNQTGVNLGQIRNKNLLDEKSILIRFWIDLLHLDFVKLLLLKELLLHHSLISGQARLLAGVSFRLLETKVLLLLLKLKVSSLFVQLTSKLFIIKFFHLFVSTENVQFQLSKLLITNPMIYFYLRDFNVEFSKAKTQNVHNIKSSNVKIYFRKNQKFS